jgi:hypothetical protein
MATKATAKILMLVYRNLSVGSRTTRVRTTCASRNSDIDELGVAPNRVNARALRKVFDRPVCKAIPWAAFKNRCRFIQGLSDQLQYSSQPLAFGKRCPANAC